MVRFMAKFTEMLNWTQIIYNEINNVRQFLRINFIFHAYAQQDRECRFANFQGKPMLDNHQIVIDIIHHICQTSSVLRCLSFGFFPPLICFFLCDCFSSMGRTRSNRWIDTMIMCIIIMNTTLYASIFLLFFLIPNRRWLFIYLSLPPVAFCHFLNFVNVILRKKRHFSRLFCSLDRGKKGKIDACFCML